MSEPIYEVRAMRAAEGPLWVVGMKPPRSGVYVQWGRPYKTRKGAEAAAIADAFRRCSIYGERVRFVSALGQAFIVSPGKDS